MDYAFQGYFEAFKDVTEPFQKPSAASWVFPDNRPGKHSAGNFRIANCGMFIVRNTAEAWAFLRLWWSMDWGDTNMEHDYEQKAATDILMRFPVHGWNRHVAVMGIPTMGTALGIETMAFRSPGRNPRFQEWQFDPADSVNRDVKLHETFKFPNGLPEESGVKEKRKHMAQRYEWLTRYNISEMPDWYCPPGQWVCHLAAFTNAESLAVLRRHMESHGVPYGGPEARRRMEGLVNNSMIAIDPTAVARQLLRPTEEEQIEIRSVQAIVQTTYELHAVLAGRGAGIKSRIEESKFGAAAKGDKSGGRWSLGGILSVDPKVGNNIHAMYPRMWKREVGLRRMFDPLPLVRAAIKRKSKSGGGAYAFETQQTYPNLYPAASPEDQGKGKGK
mmetsp:Transcript_65321/g.206362  ORF Transcript_65321/g.206362 Transcript_65321/m.206362 type:complete len:388 (+) Transcript_65321:1229-2392(+)